MKVLAFFFFFTSIVRFEPDVVVVVLNFRISSQRLWRRCGGAGPEEAADAS